jgi:hypothetical protein
MWRERFAMLLGAVLQGLSWLLIAIGAVSFFVGDKALHEFTHMNFLMAEVTGIGVSIVCMMAGFGLKSLRRS